MSCYYDYDICIRQRFGLNINCFGRLFLTTYWNLSDEQIAAGNRPVNCFIRWIEDHNISDFDIKFYPEVWKQYPYLEQVRLRITHLTSTDTKYFNDKSIGFQAHLDF